MQCDVTGSAPTPPRASRGGRFVRVAANQAAHNLAKAGQPERAPPAADQRRGWQPIPQDAWNKCAIRASSTEIATIVHFAMLRSGRKPQAKAPDAGRTSPATGIPPVFFHKGFDMKRFLIVLAVIAGMVLLSACAPDSFVREEYAVDANGKTLTTPDGKPVVRAREYSGGDANYTQYTRGIVDLQAAQKPIVSIKAREGETITLGGVESFEVYAPAGGGAGIALAPPAPKPTFMGELRGTIRELTPWAMAAGQYMAHKEDAETNRYIAGVNAARDTAFVNEFGATTRAGYGVYRDIGVAQATNPGTNIQIGAGGMYAGRDGQNGDRAGRDLNGPGANTGTIAPVTIDASGPGAVVGDGNTTNNGTDNRSAVIDSPDQSGNCRETSCNPVTTPAPAPTPEG